MKLNIHNLYAQAGSTTGSSNTATTSATTTSTVGKATTPAKAKSQGPLSGLGGMMMPILLIAVFYFLLIRPQQKKEKQRKAMLKTLAKGDKVVSRGGVYGVVQAVNEESGIAKLKIADKVVIEISISAIENINPQNAPIDAKAKKTAKSKITKEK